MVGRSSTEGDTPAGARNHDETDAFPGARSLDTENSSVANVQQNSENPSDNVKKFRTSSGEAYGFVKDGKVYVDPQIAISFR